MDELGLPSTESTIEAPGPRLPPGLIRGSPIPGPDDIAIDLHLKSEDRIQSIETAVTAFVIVLAAGLLPLAARYAYALFQAGAGGPAPSFLPGPEAAEFYRYYPISAFLLLAVLLKKNANAFRKNARRVPGALNEPHRDLVFTREGFYIRSTEVFFSEEATRSLGDAAPEFSWYHAPWTEIRSWTFVTGAARERYRIGFSDGVEIEISRHREHEHRFFAYLQRYGSPELVRGDLSS